MKLITVSLFVFSFFGVVIGFLIYQNLRMRSEVKRLRLELHQLQTSIRKAYRIKKF